MIDSGKRERRRPFGPAREEALALVFIGLMLAATAAEAWLKLWP